MVDGGLTAAFTGETPFGKQMSLILFRGMDEARSLLVVIDAAVYRFVEEPTRERERPVLDHLQL